MPKPNFGDPVTKSVADFVNPGAVFDDEDEAARDALNQINKISMDQKSEYTWLLYHDNQTGKIGYTMPVATGENGDTGIHLSGPPGGTIIGMGHTHGAYVTGRMKDGSYPGNFDDFSGTDQDYMRTGNQPKNWTYYLGTPSGNFRKWTPYDGNQDEHFPAQAPVAAP
jgi:hypothetical protein